MKTMKMEPPNRCLIWHRWRLVKDTTATQYYECKDCRARFGRLTGNGYQPLNYRWIAGLECYLEDSKQEAPIPPPGPPPPYSFRQIQQVSIVITGCRDPHRWYASLIGQTVPYLGTTATGEYTTREPSGLVNFIQVDDADLIMGSPDV